MLKKSNRKTAPNPYRTASSPDDLAPAHRIAYEIVAERPDVLPSVERIMNAGLGEASTEAAMSLFRAALGTIGDPCRDPRVAIARCAPSNVAAPDGSGD